MRLFFWQKSTPFFSDEESRVVTSAIKQAEKNTSGEIRVFVESKCRWVDAIDRAAEVFFSLKMDKTDERNAVLVYIALKDRQLAVFGDEGIHQRVGTEYWNKLVGDLLSGFNQNNHAESLAACVLKIGDALHREFPYNNDTDKNELPDEIVFGK